MADSRVVVFFLLTGAVAGWGQQYTISTFAGGGLPATPAPALQTAIGDPARVAFDSAGNLYFGSLRAVFKVDPNGTLTHIAGTGKPGYAGDGGLAIHAGFITPNGIAVDSAGNIFVSDLDTHTVRKFSIGGAIVTVAGTGAAGFSGDGGKATQAQLNRPMGLLVDASGNLYIADSRNDRVRKVAPDGAISTVAGTGTYSGSVGDGGPAAKAYLSTPEDMALDNSGNLYIVEGASVRKVTPDGMIGTVAGTGHIGYSGDSMPATMSQLNSATGVAVDRQGNVYIADCLNYRIRQVSGGSITTIAGTGSPTAGTALADGVQAASAALGGPTGLALDAAGRLYFTESISGSGYGGVFSKFRIWRLDSTVIHAVAGNGVRSYSGDGGPAASAQLGAPAGVALDSAGNLYLADSENNCVRKVDTAGTMTTVAGSGTFGYSGDGGPAVQAQLANPQYVRADAAGNVYISDTWNNRVRKVSKSGTITTVAGTGKAGYSGDGGPGVNAQLNFPTGLAIDSAGNLYIADTFNQCVRRVTPGGAISRFAGNCNGVAGWGGDGGLATNARLNFPEGLALDNSGNLYIADTQNQSVRMVSPAGIITTVANASWSVESVAVDSAGTLYFTDPTSNSIVKVDPGSQTNTIIAGNDRAGAYAGDGGPALQAKLKNPSDLAIDAAGDIFVADRDNDVIRVLRPAGSSPPPGAPAIGSVANAASSLSGGVAPGEIVVLYGTGLGPAQLAPAQLTGTGLLATQLAGVSVLFNGTPGPMIYALATQTAAVVPYSVSGANVQIQVLSQNQTSAAMTLPLVSAAPALFTANSSGKGQAAALNQNGSLNGAAHPAATGSTVILFATGEGQTTPAGVDGKLAVVPLPHPALAVQVTIGGKPAKVQYAGGAPGETAGLMQINVQVPAGVPPGSAVPVELQVGGVSSPAGVTIAVAAN